MGMDRGSRAWDAGSWGAGSWDEGDGEPDPWAWLEEWRARSHLDRIEEVGWAVCTEPGDGFEPPYAYTVGLTRYHGHPEVIVSGVDACGGMEYLDGIGARVRAGEQFRWGDTVTLGQGHGVLLPVDQPERLTQAQATYAPPQGPPVPALQLVVSDDAGRMPWEQGWRGWPQVLYGTPRSAA